MTPAIEQLVRETIELTAAPPPELLAADAPVLSDESLRLGKADGFYLVGLIGGKDVGKSALVNALAGASITRVTSHGPGTEGVIAYAHEAQAPVLRELLEREVPGRYQIATHTLSPLRRQVLLDLPDIDSHYQSHLLVTRTMLRHLLYPIWVQSIEKYADLQPQQMLAKVAAGNAVGNFLFCLNKADQLGGDKGGSLRSSSSRSPVLQSTDGSAEAARHRPASVTLSEGDELRADFAARIAKTLSLDEPPEVFLVSAKHPEQYDLPRLRALLSREKSERIVCQSRALAAEKQEHSLLEWFAAQRLDERAARLERLRQETEEMVAERLARPLLEKVMPRIADDPAHRQALSDEILTERVARWPLVTLVHALLAPLFTLMRNMAAKNAVTLQSADALVDHYLQADGWVVASAVQTTFAQLRQSNPPLAALYAHRHLWEEMDAQYASANLSRRLASTVQRQREIARKWLAGRRGLIAPLFRWLLTVGALLWFPFVQPILLAVLRHDVDRTRWDQLIGLGVQVLGVNYLLASAGFLAIYFGVLWLALRWNTQRKVARLLSRGHLTNNPDPEVNLGAQALAWVDELTDPVRAAQERMSSLARRLQTLAKAKIKG